MKSILLPALFLGLALSARNSSIAADTIVNIKDSPQQIAQLPPVPLDGPPELLAPPPGPWCNIGVEPPGSPTYLMRRSPLLMPPPPGIDLTDGQIEQLDALRSSFTDKIAASVQKFHSLEHCLQKELCQPEIDTAKVSSIATLLSQGKETIDRLCIEHLLSVAKIFTPEQRHKLSLAAARRELGPLGWSKHAEQSGSKE